MNLLDITKVVCPFTTFDNFRLSSSIQGTNSDTLFAIWCSTQYREKKMNLEIASSGSDRELGVPEGRD